VDQIVVSRRWLRKRRIFRQHRVRIPQALDEQTKSTGVETSDVGFHPASGNSILTSTAGIKQTYALMQSRSRFRGQSRPMRRCGRTTNRTFDQVIVTDRGFMGTCPGWRCEQRRQRPEPNREF